MFNTLNDPKTRDLLARQLNDTHSVGLNLSLNDTPLSVDEIYTIIRQLETIVEACKQNDYLVNPTLITTINELKPKLLSRDLHTKLNIQEGFATFLINTLSRGNLSSIIDALELVVIRANQYGIKTTERTGSIRDRVTEITEPA